MLSKRLEAIAQLVPQGCRMADIGCDHAYLPLDLVKKGKVTYAIGCDVRQGPLEGAKTNLALSGLSSEQIELRLGDGLAPLEVGEVDVVTIAGMGGSLMVDILERGQDVVAQLKKLILSPNIAPWRIRQWAMDNQFLIIDETVVEEKGHYYDIIVLEKAESISIQYNELECYFGPLLLKRYEPAVIAYFAEREKIDVERLKAWEGVKDRQPAIAQKYQALQALWAAWREIR